MTQGGNMKKIILICILLFLSHTSIAEAELKVGDRAPDFLLKDSLGKEYSLNSPELKGRVVYFNYADIGSKDLNKHVDDALKKDPGLDRKKSYIGMGIANMKASIVPNFVIARAIKSKQQETGAIILLDPDYTILNLWGLQNRTSNIVVLDKNRICRYLYKGKMPPEEYEKMVSIIKEYQAK